MSNVKSFMERSKDFEQAHYSCRELLSNQIQRIDNFVSKWLLIAVAVIFLVQASGFTYFYFELTKLRKKVDHRYFLTKESLEDIHRVKIEKGKVIRDYKE